jgi:K+-sensing histidine kinase KdpD
MDALLDKVINITMKTLHADVCSIFLIDRENEPGVLKCVAGSGFAKKIVDEAKYNIGEGFTGSIAKSGKEFNIKTRKELETLVIDGKKVWKGKFDQSQWPSGRSEFRNGIGLPLKIKDETFGVIKVENKLELYGDHFTDDDFRTFKTIADVIALAIENARLHYKIETQLKAISAKAAHRINNQCTNYDGIELELEEELNDPTCNKPKILRIHDRLVNTTKNLKMMIGEFKNYGKPIILEKKMCSINQIVRDEAWHARPNEGIKIELKLDESIPTISIDEGRFAESIKELISNSIKAIKKTPESIGKILIETELKDKVGKKELYLSIGDSGPGFPSHFPVFEPFHTTDPQGAGLGLTTVKELVEKHGGTIRSNKSKLGGALIEFTIPAVL